MNVKFWFAVLMLTGLGLATANAEIFRTVDADGNVVFSDVPPPPDQASESVSVNPVNTFETPAQDDAPAAAEAVVPDVAHYTNLSIIAPGNDETVRENAGNVTVAVALSPPLRAGDRLVLYMDGNQSNERAQGSSFRLENLDRGSHTVGVRVIDDAGQVAAEAATSTFHLQRVSAPRKAPRAG